MRKRIFATFILVVFLVELLCTTAFAKNVCKEVSGSSNKTVSFTVETGNRWLFKNKVKLTQTKGKYSYTNWASKDKYATSYGKYTVTYTNQDNGTKKTTTWTDGSLTLKLDDYSTYIITITPFDSARMQIRSLFRGAFGHWTTPAEWSIKSTKGVTLCR